MVRGRRARNHETSVTTAVTLAVNGQFVVDDQYCASPKRKDCRIDTKKTTIKQNSRINGISVSTKSQTGYSGINCSSSNGQRQIKDMLLRTATRSQTAKKSIELPQQSSLLPPKCSQSSTNFIKNSCIKKIYANSEIFTNGHYNHKNDKYKSDLENDENNDEDLSLNQKETHHYFNGGDVMIEIKDEDDDDDNKNDEVDDNDNDNDNVDDKKDYSENIFLQEPVLSLNVDKSPNQASSIKINKTFEVESIFAPNHHHQQQIQMALAAAGNFNHLNLNGQFNKIVTLSNTPKYHIDNDEIIEIKTMTMMTEIKTEDTLPSSSVEASDIKLETEEARIMPITNNCILLNNDSNSCDSGVFIDTKMTELSPSTRRRKPATPHRILCPSPVKCPNIDKSSPNHITATFGAQHKQQQQQKQKRHPKSRRRLNANHSENSSMTPSPQLIGGIMISTDTLKKMNNNSPSSNNNHQKMLFNTIKTHITEENTNKNNINNNFKIPQKHNAKLHLMMADEAKLSQNRKMTDYFPVRRSVRKTKRAVEAEIMKNIEAAIIEGREEGLRVEFFEGKGRGIVADRLFTRGEFVVEYIGDLITISEANQREKKYSLDENAGCYMYYFKHKNQQYCIDATAESGKLGRLVNHSRNGNLITKVVVVKNRPHLVLIAKDDIQPGEELTYDYGDRSKESLLHHPWLAL